MKKILDTLRARGFDARLAEDETEVLRMLQADIPAGAEIGTGGSVTLTELNLPQNLAAAGYVVNHSSTSDLRGDALCARNRLVDYYLTSTNALTEEGELVNVDGRGNRIANMIYGVGHVFFIVGSNKIVPDIPAALDRIKRVCCPQNARRLGKNTPCAHGACPFGTAGTCADPEERMCNATLILSHPCRATKITIILLDRPLGY